MSNTSELLKGWEITINGNYTREGYTVKVHFAKKGRVIITPEGNELPEVYPFFYHAIKHVNSLLGD